MKKVGRWLALGTVLLAGLLLSVGVGAMSLYVGLSVTGTEGSFLTLEAEPNERIGEIKEKIEERTGYPPAIQRLYFEDLLLEDGKALSDYSIQGGSMLTLSLKEASVFSGGIAAYYDTLAEALEAAKAGDLVTLTADAVLSAEETVTVAEGVTLVIPEGRTLTNEGTVHRLGTVTVNGTLTCNHHSGGTAGCTRPAVCGLCGAEYGETAAHADTDADGLCDACLTVMERPEETDPPAQTDAGTETEPVTDTAAGSDGPVAEQLPTPVIVTVAVLLCGVIVLCVLVTRKKLSD